MLKRFDSQMRQHLMSILERFASRGSTALLSLLVAAIGGVDELGSFASALVVLTLVQSGLDVSFRQAGVTIWRYSVAPSAMRNLAAIAGLAGPALVGFGLVLVTVFQPGTLATTWPLVLVPMASAVGLPGLTYLQRMGETGWRTIVRAQLIGSGLGLCISLPVLFLASPITGGTLQLVVSELAFSTIIYFASRDRSPGNERAESLYTGTVLPTVGVNLVGWSQTQLERLVLVISAPVSTVGVYSMSYALSRTVSDAGAQGLVNSVRANLTTTSGAVREQAFLSGVDRMQRLSLAMQAATLTASCCVLPFFVSSSWQFALQLTPIIAVTIPSVVVTWAVSAYIVDGLQAKRLIGPQVIGVFLSLMVGFALGASLTIGVITAATRDLATLALRLRIVHADLRSRLFRKVSVYFVLSLFLSVSFAGLQWAIINTWVGET